MGVGVRVATLLCDSAISRHSSLPPSPLLQYHITRGLLSAVAPILPHLAEDAWQSMGLARGEVRGSGMGDDDERGRVRCHGMSHIAERVMFTPHPSSSLVIHRHVDIPNLSPPLPTP